MAEIIEIDTTLAPADVAAINVNVSQIKSRLSGMNITISPVQKDSLMHVAVARVAEIQDVNNKLYKVFPAAVPKEFDSGAYEQDQLNLLTLNNLLSTVLPMVDILTQAKKVLENNLMARTLDIMATAKTEGKKNAKLAKEHKQISKTFFAKNPRKKPTPHIIVEQGTMVVGNVVTKRLFVNTGSTILTFNKADGPIAELETIQPKMSNPVPLKWTNIEVKNLSSSEAGSFSVYLNS